MDPAERMTKQGVRDLNSFGKKKPHVDEAQQPQPEGQAIPPEGHSADDEPIAAVALPSTKTSEP
jgi:hypothetical protein